MESDLDALEAAVLTKWSYLEDKRANFGVDLPALVARAKQRLPDAASPAVFHEILAEVIAGLKDGHANVWTPNVPQPDRFWPFTVADTADGILVLHSHPSAEARAERGDRLLSVDGIAVEDRIAAIERIVPASTSAARRAMAVDRLARTSAGRIAVRLVRPAADGTNGLVELDLATTVAPPEAPGSTSSRPVWEVDRPSDGIARLRIRSFTVADWQRWLAAKVEERDGIVAETKAKIDECFDKIAAASPEALVIDLRGNEGGTDLLGIHVAKHLLPNRFVYFQLSALRKGEWSKPHGYEHDPVPAAERFDGPIAVLIDERCFSTTDNFLRALVEQRKNVVVIGRPTNGGTGAPVNFATLPASGAKVTACTQRVYGPRGTLTEGRGTVPDVPVKWTAADHLAGRDPDLDAALRELRSKR